MAGSDEEARERFSTMMGALTTTARDNKPHDAKEVGSKDEATSSKDQDSRGVRFYNKTSEDMDERELRIKSSADRYENLLRNAPEWLYSSKTTMSTTIKRILFWLTSPNQMQKGRCDHASWVLCDASFGLQSTILETQYSAAKTMDGFDTGPWQEEKKASMSKTEYTAERKKWVQQHKVLKRRCQVAGDLAGDVAEIVQVFGIDRALKFLEDEDEEGSGLFD